MIIELVESSSFSGLVATNTTINKDSITNEKLRNEEGGLSGQPLMEKSTNKISFIRSNTDMPIIGVGGVMSKNDFHTKPFWLHYNPVML